VIVSLTKKRLALFLISLSFLDIASAYVCRQAIFDLLFPGVNISETILEKSLSGADFEVVETDSDELAKDLFVSVYVCDTGSQSNWLSRLIHRKKLIFRYDPWNSEEEIPTIEMIKPGRVQISIGRVSSIFNQEHDWKNLSVDYKIGFVEYR
jgi:hypothetical protein